MGTFKKIDWKKIDSLLVAGCSGREAASCIGVGASCLYEACEREKKMPFSEYIQIKKSKGNGMIRVKQFEKAMKGDNVMLKLLGTNRLNQTDKKVIEHMGNMPIQIMNYGDKEIKKWGAEDVEPKDG